ncbi:hypothetical protein OX283_014790 [Flavobacterium sp. SUN052]|uniref:hypothetical protein n=1 Tax=Flavobacterium sp. SUN052 TaxID=3002441 RepID=UPI00237D69BF|nr:hypothetical protein [Flavobacterium sp. SUN052]MEC4005934.1 hypothetical protein [Flavobacterium sp. SUN052]
MNYDKIKSKIETYHNEGKTIEAAEWLLKKFDIQDSNLKEFALREKADPSYILLTTEGDFGEEQVIRMPENVFQFPLPLILTLLTHEMVHVRQKSREPYVLDRLEREWQAYYEMLFHTIFPNFLEVSNYHKKFFAEKAFSYYERMGEGSELQAKYANQKKEIENLINSLY